MATMNNRRLTRHFLLHSFMILVQVCMICSKALKCQWYQYTVEDIVGNQSCYNCPKCPPGQGLQPECGSIIKYGVRFSCEPCTMGSYSSTNDISVCTPCMMCPHEKVLRNCTHTQNSQCGKECVKGFYHDMVSMDCQPCSFCCGDSKDRIMDICKQKGMPFYKQCNAEDNDRCHPRCADNQYAVYKENTQKYSCKKCPVCEIGKGLNYECTNNLINPKNMTCVECIPGRTWASSVDSSTCKQCTRCPVGKKVERGCNSTHDTLCGDCLPGFYGDPYSISGGIHCKECSYCCGDQKDIHIKECADEGMPPNKQCAYNKRSISTCVPKGGDFYKRSSVKWYYIAVPLIVCVILVIILVGVFIWKCSRRGPYKLLKAQTHPESIPIPVSDIPPGTAPVIRNRGKMIWFPQSGIKLHLPEYYGSPCPDNAIYESIRAPAVWQKDITYPTLNDNEVLLSAAINIYPRGAKLQKPLTVEFPHCAYMKDMQSSWSLRVLSFNDITTDWVDDMLPITVEDTALKFDVTELGQTYIVIGTRGDPKNAKKRMQCTAFAGTPFPGEPVHVNVYLLDDCETSLARLKKVEKNLGHRMVSSLKLCVLDTDPTSLAHITMKGCVSEGWSLKGGIIPSEQSWFNSLKHIPKFEAVFLNVNKTKGDLQCVFAITTDDNVCVAEIPLFLYTLQSSFTGKEKATCNVMERVSETEGVSEPHVETSPHQADDHMLMASLPQNMTKHICDKIPGDHCVTIATRLMPELTADEVQQIQRKKATQLLKTITEKMPDLSLARFSETLNTTPGCDQVATLLKSFRKDNGGIECV